MGGQPCVGGVGSGAHFVDAELAVQRRLVGQEDEGGERTAQALQDYVKATIAPYKYPRRIEFVAALPRGETGKLLRCKLREAPYAVRPAVAAAGRSAMPARPED